MSLSPLDLLHSSYQALIGSPVRSSLTLAGMFVGVAAATATFQVGTISRAVIQNQLSERDAPQVILEGDIPYRFEDLAAVRDRVPEVRYAAAGQFFWLPGGISYGDRRVDRVEALAVTADYLQVRGRQRRAGRFLEPRDLENYRSVTVIDEPLADRLFEGESAVGKTVLMRGRPFVVVGVMNGLPGGGSWAEGTLVIPISLEWALTGQRDLGELFFQPHRLEDLETLRDRAIAVLERRHPGSDVYDYITVEDILERQKTFALVSRALNALGVIALAIGGIGIANITVASVMERTREIGLRRAIGATGPDIALQFITEAVAIGLVGGSAAIGTVHLLAATVCDRFDLPYAFDRRTALVALGAALGTSAGASLIPALRASRLDPVEALRSQ